jgi:hypothetical protein
VPSVVFFINPFNIEQEQQCRQEATLAYTGHYVKSPRQLSLVDCLAYQSFDRTMSLLFLAVLVEFHNVSEATRVFPGGG